MIARFWHGRVPIAKSKAYFEYLKKTGLKEYDATPGNLGTYIMRREDAEFADFLLMTLWESAEAVKHFAGPDAERAVYYPQDREFLVEMERDATHYQVLHPPSVPARKG